MLLHSLKDVHFLLLCVSSASMTKVKVGMLVCIDVQCFWLHAKDPVFHAIESSPFRNV